MRIASLCSPHVGGVYIFSDNLRQSFADQGIELRWIGVGRGEQEAVNDPRFSRDRCWGEVIAINVTRMQDQARELVSYLSDRKFDGVIIHVLAGQLQANLARYLPARFLRVMVVHSITRGTYSYARAIRDFVHATVGPSPRIRRDLVDKFGFPSGRCFEIPYGIDIERFRAGQPQRRSGRPLRILSLGRIENQSKGVFLIPEILRRLQGLDLRVTIAGDGPDLGELKRRMSQVDFPVEFSGFVPNQDVSDYYRQHDLMLMPSHFEGLSVALIEAMAAGCVPVVSRIYLVTDQLVESGVNGWLFKAGNPDAAASIIRQAHSNLEVLPGMSEAARQKAARYSSHRMGASYARLITALLEDRPAIAKSLSLEDWRLPRGIRPGVSTLVPACFKPFLRRWREKLFY